MILNLLLDKYRQRGPVGFAYDAAELAAAYGVIAVHAMVLGTAAIGGVVVGGAIGAAMWVSELAEYKE